MSRGTHPKHDTAPVSLYNRHTITFRSVSDHKNCGQKNDGQTGSRCLDKAVLPQRGGGGGGWRPRTRGVAPPHPPGSRACRSHQRIYSCQLPHHFHNPSQNTPQELQYASLHCIEVMCLVWHACHCPAVLSNGATSPQHPAYPFCVGVPKVGKRMWQGGVMWQPSGYRGSYSQQVRVSGVRFHHNSNDAHRGCKSSYR